MIYANVIHAKSTEEITDTVVLTIEPQISGSSYYSIISLHYSLNLRPSVSQNVFSSGCATGVKSATVCKESGGTSKGNSREQVFLTASQLLVLLYFTAHRGFAMRVLNEAQ